jgi:hypothetical protein
MGINTIPRDFGTVTTFPEEWHLARWHHGAADWNRLVIAFELAIPIEFERDCSRSQGGFDYFGRDEVTK